MNDSPLRPFDLAARYVFLEDGGAAPAVAGGMAFWQALASGPPFEGEIGRVAEGSGWLAGRYVIAADTTTWEKHPLGDELLVMLSGSMALVLEADRGETTIELPAGSAFVVPANTWHRQLVRTPGSYLGVTYGRGSEHRPV